MRMRRLLAEPVLHFLLMGGALFAVSGWLASGRSAGNRIVITQGVIDDLTMQHQSRWGRPPNAEELNSLVDSYVHDEILYREGVTLGLDRDDLVIKRRVRQKFEIMAEEELSTAEPTEAELSAYLAANLATFMPPAVLSFEQVYLGALTSGPAVQRAVAQTRDAVRRGADPAGLGATTLLPSKMVRTSADLVARDFGPLFATAVQALPVGEWAGPVDSAFGSHLVRVFERSAAVVPALSDVRAAVLREWENDRRRRAKDARYRTLRSQYDVTIEGKPQGEAR